MRILHVNKYLYRRGGAEGYMQDVAALQRAAGHEVEFFGMTHPENPPLRYAEHFPPLVELEPAPEGAGAKARAAARMLYSPASRRGVAAVLGDFAPDVVHMHNIYHQLSPSILGPMHTHGVTTVMTLHDYKLACPTYQFLANGQLCEACLDGRFRHAVERRCKGGSLGASALLALETRVHRSTGAYEPVRLFISPSRFLAGKMAAAGVFPDRMHVLNNFVDAAAFPAKSTPGGGIVFAGRLAAEKGVDTLIEAMALLAPPAALDIAGEGPDRTALEALAARRAPGRVTFHGRLAKDALLSLVRSAAVAVVPSRWHENQPMAVLEAFACGVPVVTTDLGGLPELVSPGLDGDVVPANDPAALAAAVAALLADPARAHAMGAAARHKATTRFAPAEHLATLMDLYDRARLPVRQPAGVGRLAR
jgi:glycosyltransferase involved in cell wall biosynthesis